MIYLLDTDHISLLDRGGSEAQNIRARLARVSSREVFASIISYEEQMRGWNALIARTRATHQQIPFYRELEKLLGFYCITPLLPFDTDAAIVFDRFRQEHVRIGSMDL